MIIVYTFEFDLVYLIAPYITRGNPSKLEMDPSGLTQDRYTLVTRYRYFDSNIRIRAKHFDVI